MHFTHLANTLLKDEDRTDRQFDRIMAMRLWPHFFGPSCSTNASVIDGLQQH